MKKTLLILSLLSSLVSFGQVGINTTNPKTTLDVSAKRNSSNQLEPQSVGMQAPRITREELLSLPASMYTQAQEGALIYITNISGNSALTTQTTNVTKVGYYYFTGSTWKSLEGATSSANLYSESGALTGNRTVAQGSNTLKFTSTATGGTNHFSVDDSTFSVNAATNKVGFGTTSPANTIEIKSEQINSSGVRLTNLKSANQLGTNENGDIVPVNNTTSLTTTLQPNETSTAIPLNSKASNATITVLDNCGQRVYFVIYITGQNNTWGFNYTGGAVASAGSTLTNISHEKITNQEMRITATGLSCAQAGYNGTINFNVKILNGNLVIKNGA